MSPKLQNLEDAFLEINSSFAYILSQMCGDEEIIEVESYTKEMLEKYSEFDHKVLDLYLNVYHLLANMKPSAF